MNVLLCDQPFKDSVVLEMLKVGNVTMIVILVADQSEYG